MRFERGQAIDHITRLGVVGGRIPCAFQIAVDIREREVDVRQLFGFGRRDVGNRERHDGRIGLGVIIDLVSWNKIIPNNGFACGHDISPEWMFYDGELFPVAINVYFGENKSRNKSR